MRTLNLILPLFLLISYCSSAQNDPLIAYEDSTSGDHLVGYKDLEGNIVIPAKFYPYGYSDTLRKMAIVLEDGFIGIDRNGNRLFSVFNFDNGPDYVEEGLFRIIDEDKMGFANMDGDIVIPPKYDMVGAFEQGFAHFAIGGERVYHGEHWFWENNTGDGYVDHNGNDYLRENDSLYTFNYESGFKAWIELDQYGDIRFSGQSDLFHGCRLNTGTHYYYNDEQKLIQTITYTPTLPEGAEACHETHISEQSIQYYPNGQISQKSSYQYSYMGERRKSGLWQWFDESGELVKEEQQ